MSDFTSTDGTGTTRLYKGHLANLNTEGHWIVLDPEGNLMGVYELLDTAQALIDGNHGDGRPCNTDLFLVHVTEHEDDHWDLRERLKSWIEGDWDEALADLPPMERSS